MFFFLVPGHIGNVRDPFKTVGVYSISDLATLTGLKAHTLRVWEKRYGLLRPKRTETNIRYYLDEDLRQLMMVVALYQHGLRISRIAEYTADQLESEYRRINLAESDALGPLRQSLIDLDVQAVDEQLDRAIGREGFEQTLFRLIMPMLEEMEVMWMSGSIEEAHEAFFRELIRRKTIREIDALPRSLSGNRLIMLLPQGNLQVLSHLFMHYFLRRQGIAVTDLGCDIQLECAISAVRRCPAEGILLVNADPAHWQFGKFVSQLARQTTLPIIISGRAAEADWSTFGGQVVVLDGIDETIQFVRTLRGNLAQTTE